MIGPGEFTPRTRFENEPARVLQTRRPIPVLTLTTTAQVIATARNDADFLIQKLTACELNGGTHNFTLYLVPPSGSPAITNAIGVATSVAQGAVVESIAGTNLLIPPGYTLQGLADTADRISVYGWGFDLIGTGGPL